MGFGSFFKGLGKGLLKAAPFAAMAIPGIGPLASAAIQGGLGAANAKASGGGWKDVLLGGGTGAALGGLSGGTKGISPSKSLLSNVGGITSSLMPGERGGMPTSLGGNNSGWLGALGNVGLALANRPRGNQEATDTAVPRGRQRRRQGLAPTDNARKRMEIRTPNLVHPLLAGRNEARAQFGLPPIEEMDYVNV